MPLPTKSGGGTAAAVGATVGACALQQQVAVYKKV
jgi:hypothetical protein